MNCSICNEGSTKDGKSTVTVERQGAIVVFKDVPALVCENCGEAYFTSEISKKLLKIANEAFKRGTELEVIKMSNVA